MQKKYLEVIEPGPDDNTLAIREPGAVLFEGDGPVNLACGKCKALLTRGVDVDDLVNRFVTKGKLLVRCAECGSHGLLPSQRMQ